MFESRIRAAATENYQDGKNPHAQLKKCVERYCELADKKVEQLYKVSSPCLDDHQFKQEDIDSVGEM